MIILNREVEFVEMEKDLEIGENQRGRNESGSKND